MVRRTSSVSARKPDRRFTNTPQTQNIKNVILVYRGAVGSVLAFGFPVAEDFCFVFVALTPVSAAEASLAFTASLRFALTATGFSSTGFKLGCATPSLCEGALCCTEPS